MGREESREREKNNTVTDTLTQTERGKGERCEEERKGGEKQIRGRDNKVCCLVQQNTPSPHSVPNNTVSQSATVSICPLLVTKSSAVQKISSGQTYTNILNLCFPLKTKRFHKWRPDSDDLFSLQIPGCNVLLGNFSKTSFLLYVLHACAEHFREKTCIFCLLRMHTTSKSGFSKFWHKSFSYSLEKLQRPCLFFHE